MSSPNIPNSHAVLTLYVDKDEKELISTYRQSAIDHNTKSFSSDYPNSGFDLYFPENVSIENFNSQLINMKVKAEMKIYDANINYWRNTGYYLVARSSISKTPLMLANHVGIIDSGYRGFLMGAFRNLELGASYPVTKHTRLLQICSNDLRPIRVNIVEENILSATERDEGGFGSTGF